MSADDPEPHKPETRPRKQPTRTGEWLAEAQEDADEARADAKTATDRAWNAIEKRATAAEKDRDYWRGIVVRLLAVGGVMLLMTTAAAVGLTVFDGEIPGFGKLSFRSEENAPIAEDNEAAEVAP